MHLIIIIQAFSLFFSYQKLNSRRASFFGIYILASTHIKAIFGLGTRFKIVSYSILWTSNIIEHVSTYLNCVLSHIYSISFKLTKIKAHSTCWGAACDVLKTRESRDLKYPRILVHHSRASFISDHAY
jgi:hypothetical protein